MTAPALLDGPSGDKHGHMGILHVKLADLELVLGRFRLPQEYVQSYALTEDDLHEVTDRAGYNRLMSGRKKPRRPARWERTSVRPSTTADLPLPASSAVTYT